MLNFAVNLKLLLKKIKVCLKKTTTTTRVSGKNVWRQRWHKNDHGVIIVIFGWWVHSGSLCDYPNFYITLRISWVPRRVFWRRLFLCYNAREATLSLINTKASVSETKEINIATKVKSYDLISSLVTLNGRKENCEKIIYFLLE